MARSFHCLPAVIIVALACRVASAQTPPSPGPAPGSPWTTQPGGAPVPVYPPAYPPAPTPAPVWPTPPPSWPAPPPGTLPVPPQDRPLPIPPVNTSPSSAHAPSPPAYGPNQPNFPATPAAPGAYAQPYPAPTGPAAVPSGPPAPTYYPPPSSYPTPAWVLPPATFPYTPGQPVPPGFQVQTRLNRPFVIGGALALGGSYLLTFIGGVAGAAQGNGGYNGLLVPVIGPFITIGTTHADAGGAMVLVVDALAQAAGATLLIYGLATPDQSLQKVGLGSVLRPDVRVGLGSTSLRWSF